MAYDDTKWGGFAKIIVDTSTLTAGDTVRVRSMTDANAIYDKTVVTAGTPLLFETEIFKDYVKICKVQEIGGVATEIAGVYKTVDYGQTIYIELIDKTSLPGIQAILNSGLTTQLLSVGDEITTLVGVEPWKMQIAHINPYNSDEVYFVSKKIWDLQRVGSASRASYTSSDNLKASMELFYTSMAARDSALLKNTQKYSSRNDTSGWDSFTAKVFPLNYKEITGNNPQQTPPNTQIQFSLFATQANRIKTYNDIASEWWSCDGGWGSEYTWAGILNTGAGNTAMNKTNAKGVVPAFRLAAD